MDALLFAVGKALCRQPLSKASLNLKHLKLTLLSLAYISG